MMRPLDHRITSRNDAPVRDDRDFVVYWMTATRRLSWNFGLQRAVELSRELDRPLVVFEALRCGYPYASDRLHRFVIEGMREHASRLADSNVTYFPYLETEEGEGSGLLKALADHTCAIVTDDFPAFFLPSMLNAAADEVDVRLEAVDSNGLFPMRSTDRLFKRAYDFRRFLQKALPSHLDAPPDEHPLVGAPLKTLDSLPDSITATWPVATDEELAASDAFLESLPIDHSVPPVSTPGGERTGARRLERFVDDRLHRYADDSRHPDAEGCSELSPYLHFGFVSAHQVFDAVTRAEGWSPDDLGDELKGQREGWWGMSEGAEAFLDQLVTWRELGFNMCVNCPDGYDAYETLPDWALETLETHADDPREHVYSLEEFEAAETHDEIWNAAQRQLLREGRIHNYLRMVWGKKILHWTESPQEALAIMIELNDRFALDGRDPNSYSGIFWGLGRYDRPWGPEREIFGKVRYMTTSSTRKKLRLSNYLEKYGV